MHIIPLHLNHITSVKEVFEWVLERLNDSGSHVCVPSELCNRSVKFSESLAREECILFVPLTSKSIDRSMADIEGQTDDHEGCSEAILEFLGEVGSIIEGWPRPTKMRLDDCLAFAIGAWKEHEQYLIVSGGPALFRVRSSADCTLDFDVLFDVLIKPDAYFSTHRKPSFWQPTFDRG